MPHVARATPSRIFEPDTYDLVFNEGHPIEMFAPTIRIRRQCDDFLRQARVESIEGFRFQLATRMTIALTREVSAGFERRGRSRGVGIETTAPGTGAA